MSKIFISGCLILLGTLAAFLYWGKIQHGEQLQAIAEVEHGHHHHPHDEKDHHDDNLVKLTPVQIEQLGLKFRKAGPGPLSLALSTRGKIVLHPDRLVHVIPKVSGIAREANKNIGDFVRAGEVIAILDSEEMADISAAYLAALSKQRLAAASMERERRLFQEKISAGQDYLNAQNAYEEAIINLQLARQKLHTFGLSQEEIDRLTNQQMPDLQLYPIRSPIDGTILLRHITKGEFIENRTTIYEVADLSTVWVEISIYPNDLHRIKEGQTVEVSLPQEDKNAQARLIYVSPIIANETITTKAIAELSNPYRIWRPGLFVKINIATEKREMPIVIPKEALQNIEGKDVIFVLTPEGFEKRIVKLGIQDNENVEVLSGLNRGEEYVANKTFLLKAELGKSSAEHEH